MGRLRPSFHLRDPSRVLERLTELVSAVLTVEPRAEIYMPEPEMLVDTFLRLNGWDAMDWFLVCTALEIEFQIEIPNALITPDISFAEFSSGLATQPLVTSPTWVLSCLGTVQRVFSRQRVFSHSPVPPPVKAES